MITPTVVATSAAVAASRAARAREEEEQAENQSIINAVEGTPSIILNKTVAFKCACGKDYKVAVLMRPNTGAAEHGQNNTKSLTGVDVILLIIGLIAGLIAGYFIAKS